MVTFEQIEVEAEKTLREAGVFGQFPVPLETVAGNLGFKTAGFRDKPDLSGAINHERRTIYVNQDDPIIRQRFTLAHEIGHAVLHKGDSVWDLRANIDRPRERKEIEANNFAANLLMPKDFFSGVWSRSGGNINLVSDYFAVSHEAAKYRGINLGLYV